MKLRNTEPAGAALILLLTAALLVAGCGGAGDPRDEAVAVAEVDWSEGYGSWDLEPEGAIDTGQAVVPEPSSDSEVTEPEVTETAEVEPSAPPREVSFVEAEAAFRRGRFDEAVDLFGAYTGNHPDNGWGFYMLGLSAWKAGRPEQAEVAFEQALDLEPGHVKSLLNLSRVLLEQGRAEEALARLEIALEEEPESGDAFRLLGRAHWEMCEAGKAIEACRQAILLNEDDSWAMNNLGWIFIQQGRFREALPPLARAVELRQDEPIFHNNLGIALERTGHYAASAQAYRSVLEIDAGYEKATVSLARVEGLEDDPDLEPADLPVLAQSFVYEVEKWRRLGAAEAVSEMTEVTGLEPVETREPPSGEGSEGEIPEVGSTDPSQVSELEPDGMTVGSDDADDAADESPAAVSSESEPL